MRFQSDSIDLDYPYGQAIVALLRRIFCARFVEGMVVASGFGCEIDTIRAVLPQPADVHIKEVGLSQIAARRSARVPTCLTYVTNN